MKRYALILSTILLAGALSSPAYAETMDVEIDYLLNTVGQSDCTFTRNGKSYPAADAQKHLQTKRKRGKRYFSSADEFIEKLASKSSMSGKPYSIQCGEAAEQPSGEWFAALLAKYRQQTGS
jgi:hypothetical protein